MSARRSAFGSGGRRGALLAATAALAVALAACGSSSFPNKPRASAPVEVTASIGPRAVKVSPTEVGAGLVAITVANQSSNPAAFRVDGPTKDSTGQVQPGAVLTIQDQLKTGPYTLSAPGSGFRSATLKVGPRRPSSQNKLLLP
jgi:hypothetical protein